MVTVLTKFNATDYRQRKNKPDPSPEACVLGMTLSQRFFMPHILPNVCLVKHHNGHGVYFPAVLCRLCCYPKTLGFKRRDTKSLKPFKKPTQKPGSNAKRKNAVQVSGGTQSVLRMSVIQSATENSPLCNTRVQLSLLTSGTSAMEYTTTPWY